MLRNYILIAIRVLHHNRIFTTINIIGLAVGLAAALILLHYVRFEKGYDSFHEQGDHIYRVNINVEAGENSSSFFTNNPGCGPMLKNEVPEVLEYVRLFNHTRGSRHACIVSYKDQNGNFHQYNEDQEKVYWADASIFSVFSFPLILGNPETALQEPYSVVISETTANKYFAGLDPVGKFIHIEDWSGPQQNKNYLVTGVFKDIPVNSHLQFDILLSFATLNANAGPVIQNFDTWWKYPEFITYILLQKNSDVEEIEKVSQLLFQKYMEDELIGWKNIFGGNMKVTFPFQSLKSIHLSDYGNLIHEGEFKKLDFLKLIAFMIVFIACVNYINLSTAKSAQRARAVGVRKVIGADRRQLFMQFFTESILVNLLAAVLAFTVIQLVSSPFNRLIGKEVFSTAMFDLKFFGIFFILLSTSILLSGIYPALFISAFKPENILKGRTMISVKGLSPRNVLVFFQFVASVILISGIYAVSSQLTFMNHQDLGFEKEKIITLVVPASQDYITKIETFKSELTDNVHIESVSNSGSVPGRKNFGNAFVRYDRSQSDSHQLTTNSTFNHYFAADADFLNTFNMRLLAGRNFGNDEISDRDAAIINEIASRKLGFKDPEDAIGSRIINPSWKEVLRIVGVIQDYYHDAPKWSTRPLVLNYKGYSTELSKFKSRRWPGKYLSAKVTGNDTQGILKIIAKKWESHFPELPFDYFFLDEHYNKQYIEDRQLGSIFGIFSIVAVIIACMGLFGLTLYSTSSRTKEIGIRKILGAPVANILTLLTKDFLLLILVASIIAIPIAYWRINVWLQNYANRIELTPFIFLLPVVLVCLIALLTVSWHTVKAAFANPVKALRYE
jgi:putative ABC transport system permease protein